MERPQLPFFAVSCNPKLRVGLEIAPEKARLVLVEQNKNRFRLIGYGARDLPFPFLEPVSASTTAELSEILNDLFKSLGAPYQRIGLAVTHRPLFLRQVVLPRLPRNEINRAVRFQAEVLFPLPLSGLVWDYSIVREKSNRTGKKIEIVLVASSREPLKQILQSLEEAQIKPAFIDIESFALYRACLNQGNQGFNSEQVPVNTVLLNIEQTSLSLHIYNGSLLRRYRVIPFKDHGRAGLEQAFGEVDRSLGFWRLENHIATPALIVTGEMSRTPEVVAFLEEQLETKIWLADPLQKIVVPNGIGEEVLQVIRACYSVPLGLTLRRRWQ